MKRCYNYINGYNGVCFIVGNVSESEANRADYTDNHKEGMSNQR